MRTSFSRTVFICATVGATFFSARVGSTDDGALPSEWRNETYKTTVRQSKDKVWEEVDNATGRVNFVYQETSRTNDVVEIYCPKRNYNVRLSPSRMELKKEGKWEWVANGRWSSAPPKAKSPPSPTRDAAQLDEKAIPHPDDETALILIKANPERYVGKEFVIAGWIRVHDYYNFSFSVAQETHYSIKFVEPKRTESCFLYLMKKAPRQTASSAEFERIASDIIKATTTTPDSPQGTFKYARIKATIFPNRFAQDKQWDMMEVIDVQFLAKSGKSFDPWFFETYEKTADAKRKQAEAEKVAAEQSMKDAEQKKKDDAEAAKWREWTINGKKTKAKFGGVLSGTVTLTKEDGTTLKISLDKLSKDDQEWIREKRWIKK